MTKYNISHKSYVLTSLHSLSSTSTSIVTRVSAPNSLCAPLTAPLVLLPSLPNPAALSASSIVYAGSLSCLHLRLCTLERQCDVSAESVSKYLSGIKTLAGH
jgi:hypothetical protein